MLRRRPAGRRGSPPAAAAAALPGARGWVGWQSMYFSPSSDCGRIRHEASWRKSWKPAFGDLHHHDRLARRGAGVGDRAVRHGRSPTRPASSRRPSRRCRRWRRRPAPPRPGPGSRRCRRSPGPRSCRRRRSQPGRRATSAATPISADDRRDPPHGPGGTSEVSHFGFGGWPPVSRLPSSVNGFEPRDRLRRPARTAGEGPELEVVELLAGRDRRQLAGRVRPAAAGAVGVRVARRAVVEAVRLRGRDAGVVAVGVVVGGHLGRTWRGSPSGRACRAGRTRSRAGRRRGRRSPAGPPCSPCCSTCGQLAQRVGDVVVRAGPVDRQRAGCGPPGPSARRPAAACAGTAPGPWSPAWTSLTTGVRSSSAARRLTKVVFAWRSVGGNATSERSSAWFWLAIAPSAWFAFVVSADEVVAALGDRAQRPGALDQELAERPAVAGQLGEQPPGRRQRRGEVLVALLRALRVARRRPRRSPGSRSEAPSGSCGRKVSKSWSRSTGEVVCSPVSVAPSFELRGVVGPGRDRDVAVRDPRQRGRPDHRGRSLVERLVDRDRHLGLRVSVRLTSSTVPIGWPATSTWLPETSWPPFWNSR